MASHSKSLPLLGVQHLSETGVQVIPKDFIQPPSDRPNFDDPPTTDDIEIPVIDMSGLFSNIAEIREKTMAMIDDACKEWGFFQLVNHGVNHELIGHVQKVWLEFFKMSLQEKQKYAIDLKTNQGYGSRVGMDKEQPFDWGDFFFLHCLPQSSRDENKWHTLPPSLRAVVADYTKQVAEVSKKMLKIFSLNLGLKETHICDRFGGDEMVASMQANYFPKCPQPDLTFGLSPHSDPGGVTFLIPDYEVQGLQVRRGNDWITIKPIRGAFIVNLGDQLEIVSNGVYKSVEHRVYVNSNKDRFSLVIFFNPKYDLVIKPAEVLVNSDRPQAYVPITFREYKKYVAMKGAQGKSELKALKKST